MNGFFNVNKPLGVSSAKIVWQVKQKFNIKHKIGHMGTLDPLASGVLVVAVGRANRLFDVMLNKIKKYVTVFDFGYQTTTLDNESKELLFTNGKIPTLLQIQNILPSMIGNQQQVAPIFSAKNINGQRAYSLARSGEEVKIKPHNITIYDIKCLRQVDKTSFEFEIVCSGGTYIRSICRDLALKLDTYATMVALNRTQCGCFCVEESSTVEALTTNNLIDLSVVLQDFKKIELDFGTVKNIRDGKKIEVEIDDGEYGVYSNNLIVGIGKVTNKTIKIKPWLF